MIGFEYNAPRPAQNSLIIEDFTILEDEPEPQPISMSIYSNTIYSTCGYFWEYVYHGPSDPTPVPHISDLFKLVLRHWLIPSTRRYNFRSQPRWKRGRWKSKT